MLIERFKRATDFLPPKSWLQWLHKKGVSPFVCTFISFCFKIAATVVFAMGHTWLGGWLVLLDYIFDGLDGRLARATKTSSVYGAFIDLFADRLGRAAWAPALAYADVIPWQWAAASLLLDLLFFSLADLLRHFSQIKPIPWMPDVFRTLLFGALLNLVQVAYIVKFVVAPILFVVHACYVVIQNRQMRHKTLDE